MILCGRTLELTETAGCVYNKRLKKSLLYAFLSLSVFIAMVLAVSCRLIVDRKSNADDLGPEDLSSHVQKTVNSKFSRRKVSLPIEKWNNLNEIQRKEMAESLAGNLSKLRSTAIANNNMFQLYVDYYSPASLSNVCQAFNVSNLTSANLQRMFLKCAGWEVYKRFSDSKGNVKVPKPFHSCKNMSFQNSGVTTILVSWPGSGNSWVRQLLEATTGIYTGSKDCDIDYVHVGMLGEGIASENVIAIKSHFSLPKHISPKKVIYVVRNLFDAFVAEWNRKLAKRKSSSGFHTSNFDMKYFRTNVHWDNFVYAEGKLWTKHIGRWLGSNRYSVLAVKYENLSVDIKNELIRMMLHLEHSYTEDDLDCTINSDISRFHRKHSLDDQHYTAAQTVFITKQIKLANKFLQKHNITYT